MSKQVAIIGLGQFGMHLARTLVKMGCEVIAIDTNESRVEEVRDDVHRALIGDARDPDMLASALPGSLDEAVVALGETSIEPSILCTLHLKRQKLKSILSTARNDDHAMILRAVGANEIIFPERETAERTARHIANPDLRDMFSLDDDYRIMEIVSPGKLCGKTLAAANLRRDFELLVLAVKRKGEGKYDFLPNPDSTVKQGDVLMVLGRELDLARFTGWD